MAVVKAVVIIAAWLLVAVCPGFDQTAHGAPLSSRDRVVFETDSTPLMPVLPTEMESPTALEPAALFQAYHLPETDPKSMNYKHDIESDGYIVRDYLSPERIAFDMPDRYTSLGVTTFRGNNFRNGASWGTANITEEKFTEVYKFNIGFIDKWTGAGWTGQPSIVKWPASVQARMNLRPEKKEKAGLIEVIYGTLDGKIRFFDLEDGKPTRDPIVLGEPIKGSITVDPRGYPLLYVGQGVAYYEWFGYYIYSLLDGQEIFFIDGRDPFAWRYWGAFDSNPIFDVAADRMYLCGENGLVYSIKLNTRYDMGAGTISIEPEIFRYRYRTKHHSRLGIESSPSAFSCYLFFGDNSGVVQCLNLATLEPVWARACTDDTDSSVVLDWENDTKSLSLYTACEVDNGRPGGLCYIRKLDAANGDLLWEYSYACHYDKDVNGGALATPVVGKEDISDRVIFWIAKVKGFKGVKSGGALVCFDKYTGEVVWENIMPYYGWSSPVAVYAEDGKSYLVVCDSAGYMYLFRGATGEFLDSIRLGENVEASPAVYGNMIVVGTRGMIIYGIKIS